MNKLYKGIAILSSLVLLFLIFVNFDNIVKFIFSLTPANIAFINVLTSFFVGLFGLIALYLYNKQKNDEKRDAANIILLEIQGAERAIKKIKENLAKEELASDIFLLPSDSWVKYKYLFFSDFDRDEWDAITDFYNKCHLLDEDIKHNNSAFWSDVEQIRANKQRVLANYTESTVNEMNKYIKQTQIDRLIDKFKKTTEKFDKLYMERQPAFGYNPQKPINDAKKRMIGFDNNLSQSAVGEKLKKMAKV